VQVGGGGRAGEEGNPAEDDGISRQEGGAARSTGLLGSLSGRILCGRGAMSFVIAAALGAERCNSTRFSEASARTDAA